MEVHFDTSQSPLHHLEHSLIVDAVTVESWSLYSQSSWMCLLWRSNLDLKWFNLFIFCFLVSLFTQNWFIRLNLFLVLWLLLLNLSLGAKDFAPNPAEEACFDGFFFKLQWYLMCFFRVEILTQIWILWIWLDLRNLEILILKLLIISYSTIRIDFILIEVDYFAYYISRQIS